MAVGAAFWVLFGWLWFDLARAGKVSSALVATSVAQIGTLAGGVLVVTLAWVGHNVRIHRRKGPRRSRAMLLPRSDADRLGRPVVWDLPGGHPDAVAAGHLVVSVGAGVKTYRAARPPRPRVSGD